MMIVVLLVAHGIMAVVLMGALTHQAFSLLGRKQRATPTLYSRFSGVNGAAYVRTITILFVVTAVAGGVLYPQYRIDVRPMIEDLQLRSANGVFEIKEHIVALGLAMLPAYWLAWSKPQESGYMTSRRWLTWMMTFIVWWGYLVGHVLNNIKGLL